MADYDLANRLAIDAVYAQFSPTLDDYYAEELRIEFPKSKRNLHGQAEVRPDLVLTRTVPGQEPRSVHAPGAPFLLARAGELLASAMASVPDARGVDTRARVGRGLAWLRPEQVGRSQTVRLVLEPGGRDVQALLDEIEGSEGS